MKNSSLISSEKLNIEFEKLDFVIKTQQQIVKDFNSVGVDFTCDFEQKNHSTEYILSIIQQKLKKVRSIEELLYRIDVPEELFIHVDDFITLSQIILKREAYKVYLKTQF